MERQDEDQNPREITLDNGTTYKVGKQYYNPEEPSHAPITLETIDPDGNLFTMYQRIPGEDPHPFTVDRTGLQQYKEDRRTGKPLSSARAAEIRDCEPGELRVRSGNDPLEEALLVKAAFEKILRK